MGQVSQQLERLHASLKVQQPELSRVALALYDAESDQVRTYAHSSDRPSPLHHYHIALSQVPSLEAVAAKGRPRVIEDLAEESAATPGEHTRALLKAGYRSSVTLPLFQGQQLLGFVFFNADRPGAFSDFLVPQLEIAAYAISLLIVQQLTEVRTLRATLESAIEVTHSRNPETGEHLRRIAGFTRLLAGQLAADFHLSEEYIEHLVLFSALHDIGKIGIPDRILLKPGRLSAEEFEEMKSHPLRGLALIEQLLSHHALENLDHLPMLRHIIELHHEHWNGSGYPHGLEGEAIPLEARIIAVADVFDALTSERPYKKRMSTSQALEILGDMRGVKLDPRCADAFMACAQEADVIRQRYRPASDQSAWAQDRPDILNLADS